MSKCIKTSMKPLKFQKKCRDVIDRSAYLPPQRRKNTEVCVFICHSRADKGNSSWQSKESLFPSDMLHFKLCPEEPHPAYLHFASFIDLTATVCHRYPDLKLSVRALSFPLGNKFAFLINMPTISEQAKPVLLRKKRIPSQSTSLNRTEMDFDAQEFETC